MVMVPAFISGEQKGSQVWYPLFLIVATFALRVAKFVSASSHPSKYYFLDCSLKNNSFSCSQPKKLKINKITNGKN